MGNRLILASLEKRVRDVTLNEVIGRHGKVHRQQAMEPTCIMVGLLRTNGSNGVLEKKSKDPLQDWEPMC